MARGGRGRGSGCSPEKVQGRHASPGPTGLFVVSGDGAIPEAGRVPVHPVRRKRRPAGECHYGPVPATGGMGYGSDRLVLCSILVILKTSGTEEGMPCHARR
jgi:hypothetical protein